MEALAHPISGPACLCYGRQLKRLLWTYIFLVATSARPSRADSVADIGGVSVVSVVNTSEITHKWWFWLIIGIVAAFFVVVSFFVWRGWRQWKLQKKRDLEAQQQQQQEEGKLDSSDGGAGRVGVEALSAAQGKASDLEMGVIGAWGFKPPVAGEPPSEELAAYYRERERRTAAHPKRKW